MFSGVHYVTVDYMLYIQDGWITFAYWKPQFVANEKVDRRGKSADNKENGKQKYLLVIVNPVCAVGQNHPKKILERNFIY